MQTVALPVRLYPELRVPRRASAYSCGPLKVASLSSSNKVGLARSIFRIKAAAVVRPVSQGRATIGSSTSKSLVFPARGVALVIWRCGVQSAAAIEWVWATQSVTAAGCSSESTTYFRMRVRVASSSSDRAGAGAAGCSACCSRSAMMWSSADRTSARTTRAVLGSLTSRAPGAESR